MKTFQSCRALRNILQWPGLSKGDRGELIVCNITLDSLMFKDRQLQSLIVNATSYFEALFGSKHYETIRNSLPSKLAHEDDNKTFAEIFKDARLYVTHFIKVYNYESLSAEFLLKSKGTGFLVHNDMEGDHLSHKVYVVAPDGASRAGGRNHDEQLPPFTSPRARAPADTLNPFLVAINAEMAFRRFKRHSRALYEKYEELINLTIELVQKIYFQPLVSRMRRKLKKSALAVLLLSKAQKMHREMYTWEVWMSSERELVTTQIKSSLEGVLGGSPGLDEWLRNPILVHLITRLSSTISASCLGEV